ncbi:hypothetical protein EHM76_05735 [bacterium]|nr:MAG: hypothetical protein EHM76_05735 [bacterium]
MVTNLEACENGISVIAKIPISYKKWADELYEYSQSMGMRVSIEVFYGGLLAMKILEYAEGDIEGI